MQELALSELGSHEISEVSVGCTALCAWSFELTPSPSDSLWTAELWGAIGSGASTQQHIKSCLIVWEGGRVSSLQKLVVANRA